MSDDLVKRLRMDIEPSEGDMEDAADCIEAQAAELTELRAFFDKCWQADQRAIKAWQEAHPGNDLVWPDRTKMIVWLLEKENAASTRIAELEAALEDALKYVWRGDWNKLKPETQKALKK